MLKMWQKRVWNVDGDLAQDSISAYSEMPGEHSQRFFKKHKPSMPPKKQNNITSKAKQDAIRKAGL